MRAGRNNRWSGFGALALVLVTVAVTWLTAPVRATTDEDGNGSGPLRVAE
jgi:hypothetical protein